MGDLAPIDRVLVEMTASLAGPDWDRFDTAANRARELASGRTPLEETLLQATLFFGFPRVVSAFERLSKVWPADASRDEARVPEAERPERGRALFDTIYGDNAEDVHAMLASFHPEFHDFVLESAYGRILARSPLTPLQRELCAIGALASLDQIPQLVAHARGAMRFGASEGEVRDSLRVVLSSDEAAALLDRILRRNRDQTS
ncbi:MAG: carboxymuconolactone decarboxylase family protein [Planctomycetes bacterium]|nr:carboxymuconolactone decarboxylase family protein [Planctomycetota bacterium]